MKNPIPHYCMVVTESISDVFERIVIDYSGAERDIAMQVAMLTLNACHQAVEEKIFRRDVVKH